MKAPKTLQEAIVYFADSDRAFDYAVKMRWPDGKVICPRCSSDKHSFIKTRRIWYCNPCKKQFTVKVGSIFEDSALGLDKWMTAVWMLVNCKNGVSSWEIHRSLGVTQKTAWFMLQRARLATQDPEIGGKLGGSGNGVEVDETFIGAKARNMHGDVKARRLQGRRGGTQGKAIVAVVLERGGKARTKVIDRRKKKDLQSLVRENVEAGSALYSDSLKSYEGL